MAKNRDLTIIELEESRKLKAIFKAKKKELGLTQETLGDLMGFSSPQSSVSQYMGGKLALNLAVGLGFAKLLKCNLSDFSPRLAVQVGTASNAMPPQETPHGAPILSPSQVDLFLNGDLPADEIAKCEIFPPSAGWDKEGLFALRYEGGDEVVHLRPNDLVLIDPGLELAPGPVSCFGKDGKAYFGYYHANHYLTYTNNIFKPIELDDSYTYWGARLASLNIG